MARASEDDGRLAQRADDRGGALRDDFNETFWLPDRGWYAVALDGDKRPVDALASNMGHCLWTGIVDEEQGRPRSPDLLLGEMFSGWGVRTLATSMGAYNPMSYHNGSVWPHDNAIVAAGLMRYGFVEEAQRRRRGLLDAAEPSAAGCRSCSAASTATSIRSRCRTRRRARRRPGPRRSAAAAPRGAGPGGGRSCRNAPRSRRHCRSTCSR